jgi:hypothetical protein
MKRSLMVEIGVIAVMKSVDGRRDRMRVASRECTSAERTRVGPVAPTLPILTILRHGEYPPLMEYRVERVTVYTSTWYGSVLVFANCWSFFPKDA